MSEYSSICPLTGMECSARAYIITELEGAEKLAKDPGTSEEMQMVASTVHRAAELMLVPLGCNDTDCSAARSAVKEALNPVNYTKFARSPDII